MEWPRGRVLLFLGNKETGPLTSLEAAVPPVPGLRLLTQPIPPSHPPGLRCAPHPCLGQGVRLAFAQRDQ